jgi:hypothetical protein
MKRKIEFRNDVGNNINWKTDIKRKKLRL